MAGKIISRRLLKSNREIVAINNDAARRNHYNVEFRIYNRERMATESHSSRFLQEIKLSDGRIARVYARTPLEAEEIRVAIEKGELVIKEKNVKPAEKVTTETKPKKVESEEKGPDTPKDPAPSNPPRNAHAIPAESPDMSELEGDGPKIVKKPEGEERLGLAAEIVKDEKNKDYLAELEKDEKYYKLEDGEKPKKGYKTVDIPIKGTDEVVTYAVSKEKAEVFTDKVKSGEIVAELPKETVKETGGVADPDGDPTTTTTTTTKVEGKDPEKGPDTPKPSTTTSPTTKEPVKTEAEKKPEEKGELVKAPKLEKPKKNHHIARTILNKGIALLAGAAILTVFTVAAGLPVVGLVIGLFAMHGMGKKMKMKNEKYDRTHPPKPKVSAKDENLTAELQAELAEQQRLEQEIAIIEARKRNAALREKKEAAKTGTTVKEEEKGLEK